MNQRLATTLRISWLLLAALLLAACGPNRTQLRRAVEIAEARAPTTIDCQAANRCALDSPLQALADRAFAGSTPERPRHFVRLLEGGQDALLARIHLIRAARESIDLQSFIFAEDDSGYFIVNELLQAARRGVRVRVLLDQLYSFEDVELLARLSTAHANFSLHLYNPTFGEARTEPLQFAAGVVCCFFRFNQRMHNKLLLADGRIGITGGRNYQNRYFDWDDGFNYRDRDVLVAGPAAADMQASFDTFFSHSLSVPVAGLRDVAPLLLDPDHAQRSTPAPRLARADRIMDLSAQADDFALVERALAADALEVGRVEYISDLPNKSFERKPAAEFDTGTYLRELLEASRHEIVLQTPYLVLSRNAKRLFRKLQERPSPPQVIVSTNSLASTDAFPVYALSHKYKRSYLREYGFQIYEYKPFPAAAPIDIIATGAVDASGTPVPGRSGDAAEADAGDETSDGAVTSDGSGEDDVDEDGVAEVGTDPDGRGENVPGADSPGDGATAIAIAGNPAAAGADGKPLPTSSRAEGLGPATTPVVGPGVDAADTAVTAAITTTTDSATAGADPGQAARQRPVLGARATEARRRFRLFGSSRGDAGPVPLETAGVRISMHAKSLVIDAGIAVIGTHNFDPRSDHHNTESVVVVHDGEFARQLRANILADTAPGNAWVIAPRPRPPVLSGLNYSLGKVFEQLPLFDFWPWRYATSWEYTDAPGCTPMPPGDARFAECYAQVGDFPGVNLELKSIYTRILTAFGAGLAPIL